MEGSKTISLRPEDLVVTPLEMRLEMGFFDFISDAVNWVVDRVKDLLPRRRVCIKILWFRRICFKV